MKIDKTLIYIVDNKNLLKPILIRRGFETKRAAKRVIRMNLSNDKERFTIIKGKKAKKEGIKFVTKGTRILETRIIKYNYPEECITIRQKKVHRTKLRRHARKKQPRKKFHFT